MLEQAPASSSKPAHPAPEHREHNRPITTSADRSNLIVRLRAAGCVYAEAEARLLISEAASPAELERMVRQRVSGLPLEQILGWAEFCGLRIAVDPGVFVPRRRTEFLVARAVELVARAVELVVGPAPVVVDLCCGSGAVGAALAATVAGIDLYATDIDPAAVRCARRNLAEFGGQVYAGDLFDPLPDRLRGRIDILVVNAPYVPTDEIDLMPPEARLYEPTVALDGGPDGLDVQRRVAQAAGEWLAPGGHLLVETSERQAPTTVHAFASAGLSPRVARSDEWSATVVIGMNPRSRPATPGTAARSERRVPGTGG